MRRLSAKAECDGWAEAGANAVREAKTEKRLEGSRGFEPPRREHRAEAEATADGLRLGAGLGAGLGAAETTTDGDAVGLL